MVSVCPPSDALLQHLPSYLGFSYLGHGVSLHGCSSKAQPLLLTLDEGYLLTTALPDFQHGIAPLGPPAPAQPPLLGHGVGPPGRRPWPRMWGSSSRPPPLTSDLGSSSLPFLRHCSLALSAAAPYLGRGVTPLGHRPSGMGSLGFCPWARTGVAPLGHAECALVTAAVALSAEIHGVAKSRTRLSDWSELNWSALVLFKKLPATLFGFFCLFVLNRSHNSCLWDYGSIINQVINQPPLLKCFNINVKWDQDSTSKFQNVNSDF